MPQHILDIFNDDAFKSVTMSEALKRRTFKPQGLSAMNIFTTKNIRTETIAIESIDGKLSLIKSSERGAPLEQRTKTNANIRSYNTGRLAKGDKIMASELNFIRNIGDQAGQVKALQEEIAIRLGGQGGMNGQGLLDDLDLTLEHHKLGAVQGVVLDSDNSTIITDWRAEFGGNGKTRSIEFDFGSSDGTLAEQCRNLYRQVAKESKGLYTNGTRLHALVGDTMYDALIKCPDVIAKINNNAGENHLAVHDNHDGFGKIEYGGIIWENYRGTDDNSKVTKGKVGIGHEECSIFPVNAPGLFMEVFSPGEKFEHIGQMGQKVYTEIVRDLQRDTFVDLEIYSYPLYVCTNTNMLYKGTFKTS